MRLAPVSGEGGSMPALVRLVETATLQRYWLAGRRG